MRERINKPDVLNAPYKSNPKNDKKAPVIFNADNTECFVSELFKDSLFFSELSIIIIPF